MSLFLVEKNSREFSIKFSGIQDKSPNSGVNFHLRDRIGTQQMTRKATRMKRIFRGKITETVEDFKRK